MTPRSVLVVALAVAAVGFGASPARAHAMRMTVKLSDSQITVTTHFDGETHDGGDVTVTISNADREVMATGKIGADGTWSTPKPAVGHYTVVAQDDFGHRAERAIEIAADAAPKQWTANEAPVSSELGIAIGIGAIGIATLGGYWWLSKKKVEPRGP